MRLSRKRLFLFLAVLVALPMGIARGAAINEACRNHGPSPAGEPGVSINQGAQFTRTPDVMLYPVWTRYYTDGQTYDPAGYYYANKLTISNDGGFQPSTSVPPSNPIPWRLQSSGPERLPKTVYVRVSESFNFIGGACVPDEVKTTYQDDIILDETRPTIESAELAGGAGASAATARTAGGGGHQLLLKAKDKTSGVSEMLITHSRKAHGKWVPYRSRVGVSGNHLFVRVKDAAGNVSRPRAAE